MSGPRDEAERVVQRLMDELDHSLIELSDGGTIRMPSARGPA
jgi:hypothetical protein